MSRNRHKRIDLRRSHRGKRGYRREEPAAEAAQQFNNEVVFLVTPLKPYKCRHCPMFHLGHTRVEVADARPVGL